MTHAEVFIQALRQRGVRITPQREMILDVLAHSSGHMTAEEIYDQVKRHTRAINIATVYRTLDMLAEAGLVNRVSSCDGRMVYATYQHGPHLHLVCRLCGSMVDADCELLLSFVEQVRDQYHFIADWQHLSLQGVCQKCANKFKKQEA